MVEDGPGTVDLFPTLSNWRNVNDNGTTNEITSAAIVHEEAQEQMNDSGNLT